jgi:hypothetical protein
VRPNEISRSEVRLFLEALAHILFASTGVCCVHSVASGGHVKAQDRYLPSFWTRASYPRPPNKGSHENQAILPLAITMMAGLQIMSAVLLVGADTNRKETQI